MYYYGKYNDYGLNVTRNSGIWTIARFKNLKDRDNWINDMNNNGKIIADICSRKEAQYLLKKNIASIAENYNDYQSGSNQAFWFELQGIEMVMFK